MPAFGAEARQLPLGDGGPSALLANFRAADTAMRDLLAVWRHASALASDWQAHGLEPPAPIVAHREEALAPRSLTSLPDDWLSFGRRIEAKYMSGS